METSVDKGWSWVVLIGVFLTSLLSFGFLQCLGVFFVDWQEDFGASAQAVAWSSSVFIAGFGLSGLISSFISSYVSCRWQSLVGGALAAASLSCSYCISTLTHLYIIMGISGFGAGLSFTNCIIVLAFYFKKKLALASGLGLSGSPIGIFVLAPLIRYLNDEYSWRGTMTICGALLANICVFTALFRMTKAEKDGMINSRPPSDMYDKIPLKTTNKPTKSRQNQENKSENTTNGYSNLPTEISQPPSKRRLSVAQHVRKHSTAMVKPYATVISIRLIMMSVVAALLSGFAYISAILYFVNNAINLGISKIDAAFLLSILGMCSCIGRLVFIPIIDKKFIQPSQLGSFLLAIGGLTCLIGTLARTYATLVVFTVVLGLTMPQYNVLLPLILKDVVGIDQFKKMFGILTILWNAASLTSLPIIGHVYDTTGDYAITFYIAGSCMILNSIVNIMDPVWQHLDRRFGISPPLPIPDDECGKCDV